MSSENATPRPWEINRQAGPMGFTEVFSSNTLICDTRSGVTDIPESEANAALIVRAVNSFDAAKAALEAILSMPENINRADTRIEMARAALALMEGGAE